MKATALLLTGLLLLTASACGSDTPPGTLTEDDLPSSVKVDQVRHDRQAGQVDCQDVNDAEDTNLLVSTSLDADDPPAVALDLAGPDHQSVASLALYLRDPKGALEKVGEGLDACVSAHPDHYQRFEVKGHPDAIGYTASEGTPTPIVTRRILVPTDDRVVIVSATRQGGDDFAVQPDSLLDAAIKASPDAPEE